MVDPYIIETNGVISLKKDHQYYFQTQMEMFSTERSFCQFGVWSKTDLLIILVERNDEFLIENLLKAEEFFLKVILPELLGKFFSRQISNFF